MSEPACWAPEPSDCGAAWESHHRVLWSGHSGASELLIMARLAADPSPFQAEQYGAYPHVPALLGISCSREIVGGIGHKQQRVT